MLWKMPSVTVNGSKCGMLILSTFLYFKMLDASTSKNIGMCGIKKGQQERSG